MKIGFVKVLVLMVSFPALYFLVDIDLFYQYLLNMDFNWVFYSLILIVTNQVISSFRFKFMLMAFGVNIRFDKVHKINIYSILSGILFFNFFGQSISRSYLVSKVEGSEASFVITALERAISLSMLLIVSIALSVYVFGSLTIPVPSMSIIIAILFVVISIFIFYACMLLPRQRREIQVFISSSFGRNIWIAVFLVMLMHISMLGAYLCVVLAISDSFIVNHNSILANMLTMLGGALPISFGGWGAREISASFAYKAASLPSELGVSAGVGVGLLTLVALAINLLIVIGSKKIGLVSTSNSDGIRGRDYSRRLILLLSWLSAPVIFVLVMVQVPLPLENGKLTVNLADPIAIVVGMTFVLVLMQKKAWMTIWVDPHIVYWLFATVVVLLSSYVIGFHRIGHSDWALYNRLVGSGVLFSYFVVGLVSTAFWGELAVRTSVKAVSVSILVVSLIELSFRIGLSVDFLPQFGQGYEYFSDLGWSSPRWTGLLYNPNSYAFFLVCVFCFVFSFGKSREREVKKFNIFVCAVVLLFVYLTMSRAAWISLLFVSCFMMFVDWKRLVYCVVLGFVLYFCILGVDELFRLVAETGARAGAGALQGVRVVQFSEMQNDRISSLVDGWSMFLGNPIIGAGLGAFYEGQASKGAPLLIHNSFLWVLAEMGIVGFCIVIVPPVVWALHLLFTADWRTNPYLFALLMILLNAAVMGMAHELVYQRIFWLACGMLLAKPFCLRERSKTLHS